MKDKTAPDENGDIIVYSTQLNTLEVASVRSVMHQAVDAMLDSIQYGTDGISLNTISFEKMAYHETFGSLNVPTTNKVVLSVKLTLDQFKEAMARAEKEAEAHAEEQAKKAKKSRYGAQYGSDET